MKKTIRIRLLAAGLLAVLLSGCSNDSMTSQQKTSTDEAVAVDVGSDPHSYAEFEKVRIRHMQLDLTADMDRHTLAGHVLLDLERLDPAHKDRKSTRLNSSHVAISYAVFCLKKKNSSIASPAAVKLLFTPSYSPL